MAQRLHVLQVERLADERVGACPVRGPPARRASDRHHDVRDQQARRLFLHKFERLSAVHGLERAMAHVRQSWARKSRTGSSSSTIRIVATLRSDPTLAALDRGLSHQPRDSRE
jgi:hypothetical protein